MDFVSHLKSYLSDEEIAKLLDSFNDEDKHACLLNPSKMDDETFLSLFPNVIKHPFVNHAYIYDKNEYQLGKSVYHDLGCFYLQEPSAMLPAFFLKPNKDDVVLDLCAAPGGKTIQSSFLMNNEGLIIANDLSRSRCNAILENVERLGLGNVVITNNDFSKIYQSYQNYFDKIILDAPCSGSGMFRKDDKMKDDWSYQKVLKNREIQKQLILIAYSMLKEGGEMVYSTCSYSKEEDEDVISYLLDNSDAQIEKIDIKDGYINPLSPIGIRLMPSHFCGEGQYVCHIRKPGKIEPTKFKNNSKFCSKLSSTYKDYDTQRFGDTLFAVSNMIDTKGLRIIRHGVKVGEEQKGIFKYDIHYARTLSKNDDFPSIELTIDEVKQYLEGNQLNKENKNKGYVLLTYHSNSIDIAKTDGRVIKNHYPKGLRRKY